MSDQKDEDTNSLSVPFSFVSGSERSDYDITDATFTSYDTFSDDEDTSSTSSTSSNSSRGSKRKSPRDKKKKSKPTGFYSAITGGASVKVKKEKVTGEPDSEGFFYVCKHSEVPYNGKKYRVHKRTIALFKTKNGRVYAMKNSCSHANVPLAGGDIEEVNGELCVKCPGHGIKFNLKTGAATRGKYKQSVYKVKKKKGEIWVRC